jgi:hypothetical protein
LVNDVIYVFVMFFALTKCLENGRAGPSVIHPQTG